MSIRSQEIEPARLEDLATIFNHHFGNPLWSARDRFKRDPSHADVFSEWKRFQDKLKLKSGRVDELVANIDNPKLSEQWAKFKELEDEDFSKERLELALELIQVLRSAV